MAGRVEGGLVCSLLHLAENSPRGRMISVVALSPAWDHLCVGPRISKSKQNKHNIAVLFWLTGSSFLNMNMNRK